MSKSKRDSELNAEELTKKINSMKLHRTKHGTHAVEFYNKYISTLELMRADKIGKKKSC